MTDGKQPQETAVISHVMLIDKLTKNKLMGGVAIFEREDGLVQISAIEGEVIELSKTFTDICNETMNVYEGDLRERYLAGELKFISGHDASEILAAQAVIRKQLEDGELECE